MPIHFAHNIDHCPNPRARYQRCFMEYCRWGSSSIRAMRPIYGCPENFRESLSTPVRPLLLFQKFLMSFSSDRSYVILIHQRHRQRDTRTTCNPNTALCTIVHRTEKHCCLSLASFSWWSPETSRIAFLRSLYSIFIVTYALSLLFQSFCLSHKARNDY